MKKIFFYRKLMPEFLRDKLYTYKLKYKNRKLNKQYLKDEIIRFLKSLENKDKEIEDIISYLQKYELDTFPIEIKDIENVNVYKSDDFYNVDFYGKKMFFKKDMTKKTVENYYKGIIKEQSSKSPHCYLSEHFQVDENSIVADIGAAEGNFSLSILDKARYIYIFESDPSWINALQKTFEPWKEKVEIINKFVSDNNDGNNISLDSFFKDKDKPNFIKLDVEGFEDSIIKGAKNILDQNDLKVAICTYHKHNDDKKYKEYFDKLDFQTYFSNGYMIFMDDVEGLKPPYIRRGVLRAFKNKK